MSAAELQALQIIETHHLHDLPDDVKQHVIIMLGNMNKHNVVSYDLPPFGPANMEEAIARVEEAMADYNAGNYIEEGEFDSQLEAKFPWLKE